MKTVKNISSFVIVASICAIGLLCWSQPYTHSELAWRHNPPWSQGGTNPPPPCLMVAPLNMSITVTTNSVLPIQLAGSSGVYGIGQSPTNGTLSSFNPVTGTVTYTENNSSATQDYFSYYTSNSPTCFAFANVLITVEINTLSCGTCINFPPYHNPITGDILIQTPYAGLNVQVCIEYTNSFCQDVTNCTFVDANGTANFSVSFCPGSSNYCVVSAEYITNFCYPTTIQVLGSGTDFANTFYVFDQSIQESPLGYRFQYTNDPDLNGGHLLLIEYDVGTVAGTIPGNCSAGTPPFVGNIDIIDGVNNLYYYSDATLFNPAFPNQCVAASHDSTYGYISGWINPGCAIDPVPPIVRFKTNDVSSIQVTSPICP